MKLATPQAQPQKSNGSIWLSGSSVAAARSLLIILLTASVLRSRTIIGRSSCLGGSDAPPWISIKGPGCAGHRRDPPGPGRTRRFYRGHAMAALGAKPTTYATGQSDRSWIAKRTFTEAPRIG